MDAKLGDFAETRVEVDNYRQKFKDKYQALNLPDVTKITEMIEKFKGKYPNIAWNDNGQNLDARISVLTFCKILSFLPAQLRRSVAPQIRSSADPQVRRSAGPQLRKSEVRRQLTTCSKNSAFHALGAHSNGKLTPTHTL